MREVRVVSAEGEQLGIMPIQTALETARGQELDLVEVAPEAQPPVCRIMDFGKYKYTQARRLKEARKKQTTILVKEVKMGPKTEKHDFDFKVKHVRRFLEEGHKAKVTVRFKGREMAHPQLGRQVLDTIANNLKGLAAVEKTPLIEGRSMTMILSRSEAAGVLVEAATTSRRLDGGFIETVRLGKAGPRRSALRSYGR